MKNESRISVRTLTAMALLIAMSIVFSRVLSISTGFVRFNLGSLPVLLAGILFGPWAGFVVGMVADIIGSVLAGYAINPLITLGAASIGLVGGLGWQKLSNLRTGNRLTLAGSSGSDRNPSLILDGGGLEAEKDQQIICVGTTSCRTLESACDEEGILHPMSDNTSIFIYPGYRFKATDALITNFHLPESTLLMLVSALAGRDYVLRAYETAVKENYRFFSFGDAMLIL